MLIDNGLDVNSGDGFQVDSERAKGCCGSMPDARKQMEAKLCVHGRRR